MSDNFTPEEQLYRYFDGELEGEEKKRFEAELESSPELKRSLETLSMSRYAVNHLGILQSVSAVHESYLNEIKQEKNKPVRRGWVRYAIGVAAAAAVIIALFLVINPGGGKTNPQDLYASVYKPYDNTQTRAGATGTLEQAYRQKNYPQVIAAYQQLPQPVAKEKLLAACAYLETGETAKAQSLLVSLQEDNHTRPVPEFVDDAEYYLALCYLKMGRLDEAGVLFRKIQSNPAHLYADKINETFMKKFNRLQKNN